MRKSKLPAAHYGRALSVEFKCPVTGRFAVLKQNVDRAQVAVKAERKRQQVQAAQKKLQRAVAAQI